MAIGLIGNIEPETFAQANPFLTGFATGQDIIGQGLQNQGQYYQNKITQQQVPYAGPMAAAQLGLTQAQAGLANAQIPYVGYQALGSLYGGMGRMMASNPSAMIIKAIQNNPQLQALMNNNPQFAQEVENAAMIEGAMAGGGYFNMIPPVPGVQGINGANQNFNTTQPVTNNSGINMPGAPNGAQLPNNMAPPQTPQSAALENTYRGAIVNGSPIPNAQQSNYTGLPPIPVPTNSPQQNASDIAAMQAQNTNDLLTKNLSKQQLAAITYDNSAHNMIKRASPYLPDVVSFSDVRGMTELKRQQLLAAQGKPTSPAYQHYLNYTREQMPSIANEIRRAFQGQATDAENENINSLLSTKEWDQNPQNNLQRLQSLMDTLDDNTKAITQTYAQNYNQAINQQPVKIPGANQSQTSSQIQIPQFNSSKEFNAWYKQLPYQQQLQVYNQLRNNK